MSFSQRGSSTQWDHNLSIQSHLPQTGVSKCRNIMEFFSWQQGQTTWNLVRQMTIVRIIEIILEKIPFISNMKRPACASEGDGLATLQNVYDSFIGQKILKLGRQESWPFGPCWAADIARIPSWTYLWNFRFSLAPLWIRGGKGGSGSG